MWWGATLSLWRCSDLPHELNLLHHQDHLSPLFGPARATPCSDTNTQKILPSALFSPELCTPRIMAAKETKEDKEALDALESEAKEFEKVGVSLLRSYPAC
jgi:hypothetical protein